MLAELVHKAFELNVLDYAKKRTLALCEVTERVAAGITSKLNIKNYLVHQAVMDSVSLNPYKVVWAAGSTTIFNFLVA